MKRKTFDNYDYEEAFPVELDRDIQKKARKNFEKEHPLQVPDYEEQWKEQQEKLKEWELERLLKEGKVEKAIVYCMAYGPLSNYEMAIFSDIDARKSLDYKFKQGQIAYRADIFAGGAVAAHNGFIRVKRPASA